MHNNLRLKRILILAIKQYPLLLILPPVLTGQLVGYYLAAVSFKFTLPAFVLLTIIRFSSFNICLLLGVVISVFAFSSHDEVLLNSELSYIARVTHPPRYQQSGKITLRLTVEGILNSKAKETAKIQNTNVLCSAAHLPWRNASKVKEGQLIVLKASFSKVRPHFNPFHYESTLFRKGITNKCKISFLSVMKSSKVSYSRTIRDLLQLRANILLGEGDRAALFLSMALGVRDQLTDKIMDVFKKTGLAHLLVVSGYQVCIIYFLVLFSFKKFLSYRFIKLGIAVSISAAIFFVWITGIDGSSLRAIIAILLILIAKTLERGTGMLRAWLSALLIINIIWPCAFLEPGIQLTFAALLGIMLGVKGQVSATFNKKRPSLTYYLKSYISVSFWASLLPAIVAACWFKYFPLGTLIYNPVFGPFLSVVSCKLGFIGLGLHLVGLDPSGFVLVFVSRILEFSVVVIEMLAQIPLSISSESFAVRIVLLGVVGSLVAFKVRSRVRKHCVLYGV